MSIKELIGQMVMIGIEGTVDIDEDSAAIMREYAVGNVMLFGRNTDTFAQTQVLTQRLQSYAQGGIPLAIGIDVEGGRVVRFIGQWEPRTNSALILGNKNDPQRVYDQYKQIGSKLAEIGININFAPVLDIAHTPEATFIGKRMFGSDPQAVSVLIREAIGGLHDGGVASLGKHFPGHGDTANDSHDTLPVINATLEQMERYELVPFEAAIDEGVDAILVGHLSYPNLDSRYVTSVSPKVITQLLRETMGFDGVVVSDDMRMQGIREEYTAGEGAVLHIQAGGDMVLIGRHASLQTDVLDSLAQAVEDGRLSRERLEQSVRRILLMKQQYAGFVP